MLPRFSWYKFVTSRAGASSCACSWSRRRRGQYYRVSRVSRTAKVAAVPQPPCFFLLPPASFPFCLLILKLQLVTVASLFESSSRFLFFSADASKARLIAAAFCLQPCNTSSFVLWLPLLESNALHVNMRQHDLSMFEHMMLQKQHNARRVLAPCCNV